MEELKRRNISSTEQTPEPDAQEPMPPTIVIRCPMPEALDRLERRLENLERLMRAQVDLTRQSMEAKTLCLNQEQMRQIQEPLRKIVELLGQAGKKRERRFSLPSIRLPRPTLGWLLLPAALLGLLTLWYSWAALWSGLGTLFP